MVAACNTHFANRAADFAPIVPLIRLGLSYGTLHAPRREVTLKRTGINKTTILTCSIEDTAIKCDPITTCPVSLQAAQNIRDVLSVVLVLAHYLATL